MCGYLTTRTTPPSLPSLPFPLFSLHSLQRDPKYLEVEHQMAAAEFFSRQRSWTAEGEAIAGAMM